MKTTPNHQHPEQETKMRTEQRRATRMKRKRARWWRPCWRRRTWSSRARRSTTPVATARRCSRPPSCRWTRTQSHRKRTSTGCSWRGGSYKSPVRDKWNKTCWFTNVRCIFLPKSLTVASLPSLSGDANESAEDAFIRRAREGMGTDEAQFSVEFPVTGKMYLWADKYRPRKPRFFNRVHTGFEWNKYNQTHYDFDNPPPKIVQGYKFNIFYPDLIDKRSTPQYFLEPSPDNKDFGILRFHAGPPYEDIAFKIVNREWEYSHRHGFRCQFANGIFQLWFHFKRYRYRR